MQVAASKNLHLRLLQQKNWKSIREVTISSALERFISDHMTRLTSLSLSFLTAGLVLAEEPAAPSQTVYEPNWESIDSRPMPQWWSDAKFGIFIHWGPYSVPAYSKVGQYSEWYWKNLVDKRRKRLGHLETKKFHKDVYGENFAYADFVPMFTADLFKPDEWAELFEQSGAKYVVLTAKHHDGYCLWPSPEADKSWGRPWNSTNSGPMRDLVGELTTAVRKTEVKMGLYLSVYEWFNPLYRSATPKSFVTEVWKPQFKDLVKKYSPATIFVDGEWDYPDTFWESPELLSWLFNNAPNKDEVVINDRWGKGTRHKHGGYYTTEYGAGLPNAENPWEENRGMAHSFGYSKTERFSDYNSTQSLVYMLCDIVSRGGNFLLDIGPTADGRIPPLMEERLAEIGKWLDVNGEAIYGTKTWKKSCQWTEGEQKDMKHGNHRVKYDVIKLTVNPDEGKAAKEIWFTKKDKALYAICPVYPGLSLTLKDVTAAEGAEITFLGTEIGALKYEQVGDDISIEIPYINPQDLPADHAWVFKVSEIAE